MLKVLIEVNLNQYEDKITEDDLIVEKALERIEDGDDIKVQIIKG